MDIQLHFRAKILRGVFLEMLNFTLTLSKIDDDDNYDYVVVKRS
jgi:hypothetical protein